MIRKLSRSELETQLQKRQELARARAVKCRKRKAAAGLRQVAVYLPATLVPAGLKRVGVVFEGGFVVCFRDGQWQAVNLTGWE